MSGKICFRHVEGLSIPILSYLAGSKSVSVRPSDPDTMTNTALESIIWSSCKNDCRLTKMLIDTFMNTFLGKFCLPTNWWASCYWLAVK